MRTDKRALLLQESQDASQLLKEKSLTNMLLLIEHGLRERQKQILERLRHIQDLEELEEVVVRLPLEITYTEDVLQNRLIKVGADYVRVEDEYLVSVINEEEETIEDDSENVEEYYVGQKMLERLGISAW